MGKMRWQTPNSQTCVHVYTHTSFKILMVGNDIKELYALFCLTTLLGISFPICQVKKTDIENLNYKF